MIALVFLFVVVLGGFAYWKMTDHEGHGKLDKLDWPQIEKHETDHEIPENWSGIKPYSRGPYNWEDEI